MATKKKKKILMVGGEAMPFAATGGLGDVLGSLPGSVQAEMKDADVRLVMPLYSAMKDEYRKMLSLECVFTVELAWRNQYCGVLSLEKDGVTYYFIDNEYYFKRPDMYGNFDDGERYAFFCKAVMQMMPHLGFYPDILHAHDWQSALTMVYLKTEYKDVPEYKDMKGIYTIHNIAYQGKYDMGILWDIFGVENKYASILAYDGCINLMKGAIVCADRVTTVSPTYSKEIKYPEHSEGLHYILRENNYKLSGILNGIDYDYYNPETDKAIKATFTADELEGKAKCKKALQKECGLPEKKNVPLIAIITRLAGHKGLDLVERIMESVVANNDVQLVILGKGEERYENYFKYLDAKYPEKVKALITYDRDLSKRIYAGADIFVMPSKSEPCGLAQMIASRYGTVPVTRETGGLYDSIKGYYEADGEIYGNGFTFANYSEAELKDRILAALGLYADSDKWNRLTKKIMNIDFSWNISAKKYIEMYENLC